jgi:predicted nucleotidyltransferase
VGFASTDSDYDVRLIYIRPPTWYLSIDTDAKRDVIERQCPGDIDLSGWDIREALRLFAKSNPPLLEWLDSPVVYRDDYHFAAALRELLPRFYSPAACLHHYLSMARRCIDAYLRGGRVRHKKYFYVLRPLLAARWIEQERGPVPMPFARLLETIADRGDLLSAIDALLARKVAGVEMGEEDRVPVLHDFAEAELPRLEAIATGMPKTPPDLEPLNELFRQTLRAVW